MAVGRTRAPLWIESTRLGMKPLSRADLPLFCRLYTDPDTMRFVGPPMSLERARRSFGIILALGHEKSPQRFMAIVEKATGRPVGISAFQHFDVRRRRVEAGIVLDGPSRGRGFGKEGLRALVAHAFENYGLEEVWLQHAADHETAGRVPASLGFLRRTDPRDYGAAPGNCIWSTTAGGWTDRPIPVSDRSRE